LNEERLKVLERVLHRQVYRRKLHNILHAWSGETAYLAERHEQAQRAKLHYYERLWVRCLRGCVPAAAEGAAM
jgi:hypothetical protein